MSPASIVEPESTAVATAPEPLGKAAMLHAVSRAPSRQPVEAARIEKSLQPTAPVDSQPSLLFGRLTPLLAWSIPCSASRQEMQIRELRKSGYQGLQAWMNLAALRYLGITVPLLLFGVLLIAVPARFELAVGMLLVGSCWWGWTIPWAHVRRRARVRTASVAKGLPDLLELLGACLSRGVDLRVAMDETACSLRPAHPQLAEEMSILGRQASVGTLENALKHFRATYRTPDFREFTSLLADADRLGSGIAQPLFDQAEQLRGRRRSRLRWMSRRIVFRQTLAIALLLVPAACLLLLGVLAPQWLDVLSLVP